jgi:hypothetical protein
MSDSPTPKPTKLTIEDLIQAQEANERHLKDIAQCMKMMASSTSQQHDPVGYRWIWAALGGLALLASPSIPMGSQIFASICLFVITWVLLGRSQQVSAISECVQVEAKKQETPTKKWFD